MAGAKERARRAAYAARVTGLAGPRRHRPGLGPRAEPVLDRDGWPGLAVLGPAGWARRWVCCAWSRAGGGVSRLASGAARSALGAAIPSARSPPCDELSGQPADDGTYLADGGPGQEVSLAVIALGLLVASALLGTRPVALAGYAVGFAAMLVAGGALHRAMHTRRTPLLAFRWFRDMRALHQRHHIDPKVNFGIVEYGLDALLGSLVRPLRSRVEPAAPRRVAG